MDLSHLVEQHWELTHEIRLRGMVIYEPNEINAVLVASDIAAVRGKYLALTEAGREAHQRWAVLAPGTQSYVVTDRLHGTFAELNIELLTVCSAWQVTPAGVTNSHHDASYDWQIIDRLASLHDRAAPRLRKVGREVPRFQQHEQRLRYALRKLLDDAEFDWFTSPRIDSYHTVWNQMHEDLLISLSRSRSDEPTPQ